MTTSREPRMPGMRASVVGNGQRKAAETVRGVDGRSYPPQLEEELNRLAHLVFNNENGRRYLEYLKNTTINAPFDHTVTNDTLRHMEGQRFIVGVCVNRAKAGARE